MFIISLFIFILGLIVGSFLNVVICRLNTKEKILIARSQCPYCKKTLKWFDLIPLMSFIFLKGKCRYCSQKISLQYPIVEIATASLFLLIFNFKFLIDHMVVTLSEAKGPVPLLSTTGFLAEPVLNISEVLGMTTSLSILNFLNLFYYLIIVCFLIIIFVYDLRHYIIPDKVIYPAIGIALFYQLFRILDFEFWNLFGIWNLEFGIFNFLFSAILAAGFFLGIVLISRGKGMGMGDVKLAFLIGLILGWPNVLVALFLAFLSGAIAGLLLIIIGKKTLKSEIPFGPFLVAGTFIGLFFGDKIIGWYLNLFMM